MSEDQYDYYQYEEQQQEESAQENVQMTLEFENCQAEEYLRENNFDEALRAFTQIYNKATQHNIRTWKAKALHQLLDMHIKMRNGAEAKKILHSIREMNEVDRTNEQAVKSIIKTLNSVQRNVYESFWEDIFGLIFSIEDPVAQLKCLLLMLQKEIQEKNIEKSSEIYEKVGSLSNNIERLPLSAELQFKYLQILYLKLQKQEYTSKLRSLYIKLPNYEEDSNSNQSYISSIKQFIAPALYEQQNYVQCASFLCGSFVENAKYGSNFQKNKQLLKLNSLMVLLCGDLKLLEDNQYNPILHESTASYKIQLDIQALYGLFESFKAQDITQFQQILKSIKLGLPQKSPYYGIEDKLLGQLKKEKIASICKCYKTIKFDYIKRRINESSDENIKRYLFSLITSGKINGIIHLQDKYLEIVAEDNTFYTVQIQNLKDLTEKMN